MQRDCDNCKYAETPAFFEPCASCGGSSYWEPEVKTNGDRIRSMTDEEMAKYLYYNLTYGGSPPDANCDCVHVPAEACEKCWLDWLKEEVKEGE